MTTTTQKVFAASLLVLPILMPPVQADADWKPTRNVELVIPAGVGGSNDHAGRMIQRVIKKHNLLPVSLSVVNKQGSGGAIAYAYLNQFKGDAHHISVFSTPLVTRPIQGRSNISFRELTPLAHLLNEYSIVMVRSDSPIKDGRDLVNRLKADITSVSFAIGTSRVNTNGMTFATIMDTLGMDFRKMRILTHKSGGTSYAAVLGGHVDVYSTSVGGALKRLKKGQMRAIAISAPERLTGDVAHVPTWKEQGVDAVFFGLRGVIGPKNLSADQIKYWDGIIGKIVQTDIFKEYAEQSGAVVNYTNAAETSVFLAGREKAWSKMMTKFGLVKKKKNKEK
jgi:putative tricarboxylic transport membrane protein